jgi:hypothetical protein
VYAEQPPAHYAREGCWHPSTSCGKGETPKPGTNSRKKEQQRLLTQVSQTLGKAGGKRWYANLLTELNWARYFESRTTLGTPFPAPE